MLRKEKKQNGESVGPITTTRKSGSGIHVRFLCAFSQQFRRKRYSNDESAAEDIRDISKLR